jgi:hypothetical protein
MSLPPPDRIHEVITTSVDPDTAWTVWALGTLREVVAVDLRTAHRIERQHEATPIEPTSPDFALMQSRIARSIRLCIAMTERIREAHKNRRDETPEEKQARLQRRRAQIVRAVVETTQPYPTVVDPSGADPMTADAAGAGAAMGEAPSGEAPLGAAVPAGAAEAESRETDDGTGEDQANALAATVWETLTEDEALDADLETQPIDEMVLRICRKLGRIPDWVPLSPAWAEAARAAQAEREAGAAPGTADDFPGVVPQEAPPPVASEFDAAVPETGRPPDRDDGPALPEAEIRPDRWARRRESG